jgi:hypothetical protein
MKAEPTNGEACPIARLDRDMRRMLTVQIKELVHHIEDHEGILSMETIRPVRNVTWISMYDKYKIA